MSSGLFCGMFIEMVGGYGVIVVRFVLLLVAVDEEPGAS